VFLQLIEQIRATKTDATANERELAALLKSQACPQCDALIDPLRFRIADPSLPNRLLAANEKVFDLLDDAHQAARGCNAHEIMRLVNQGTRLLYDELIRFRRIVSDIGTKIAPYEVPYPAEAIRKMRPHGPVTPDYQPSTKKAKPSGQHGKLRKLVVATVMLAFICSFGLFLSQQTDTTIGPSGSTSRSHAVAKTMKPRQVGLVSTRYIWRTPTGYRINPKAPVLLGAHASNTLAVIRRTGKGTYFILLPRRSEWIPTSKAPGIPVIVFH
jgi:hypothetical protein